MIRRRSDILMVTFNSPAYVRLSLPRLLDSCGANDQVWLWHNGDHEETLETVRKYANDPRVAAFHHSRENVRLAAPTNWMWARSTAEFVSKVDDDCLVGDSWLDTFAVAHAENPDFGVVGSWRHPDEDVDPLRLADKIATYNGGHRLLRNLWVQGSGYLLARRWIDRIGPLRSGESFTRYCIRLAKAGSVNGWYYPFVREDHMDDPRSRYTQLHTTPDLLKRLPLSAQYNGVRTLEAWQAQIRQSAVVAQSASLDPRHYEGWRMKVRAAGRRASRAVGLRVRW